MYHLNSYHTQWCATLFYHPDHTLSITPHMLPHPIHRSPNAVAKELYLYTFNPALVKHSCTRQISQCRSTQASSSSSSELSSSELSPHPSASRFSPLMPKLSRKPTRLTPPKIPNANASPLGRTCVAAVNKEPDTNGPAARPAADSVCASPLSVPRTEWLGAELVICKPS